MVTIALAIPHTPWVQARVESCARLVDALTPTSREVVDHKLFTERTPNWKWSEDMWRWAVSTDASHFLTLQDDVLVAPNFWPALRSMLEAHPEEVICLESVHPATPALAREGHRWMTTSDLMVGVGYVLPTALLREFLAWRERLTPGPRVGSDDRHVVPEDTLLACWCVATGRKIWHPIPTIIDHDTDIPSSYGHEAHTARRPEVRWNTWDGIDGVRSWRADIESQAQYEPVHLGRMWDLSDLIREIAPETSSETLVRYVQDDGARVKRRLAAVERARRAEDEPIATLLLCTPCRDGHVHKEYCAAVWGLAAQADLDVRNEMQLAGWHFRETSIVHMRARMIRHFLASDCSHLLFVDADISFDPLAVYGMLASGRDFVQVPYPRRGEIDWRGADQDVPAEARGHRYSIRAAGPWAIDEHNCAEIYGTGLGLTLLSRACLEKMTAHFSPLLTVTDDGAPTVMLTTLMMATDPEGRRVLLSEDYSLCERWRQTGGKVYAYLGPGSPATHHGDIALRGAIESLGLRRVGR
jgi:hypothetical protein